MDGMIQGGWNFVWAAYGITWVVVLGYAAQLVRRTRPGAPPPTSPGPGAADVGPSSS